MAAKSGQSTLTLPPKNVSLAESRIHVKRLRSQASARQVPGVQLALAHANGGVLFNQATAVLGLKETL